MWESAPSRGRNVALCRSRPASGTEPNTRNARRDDNSVLCSELFEDIVREFTREIGYHGAVEEDDERRQALLSPSLKMPYPNLKNNKTVKILEDAEKGGYGVIAAIA